MKKCGFVILDLKKKSETTASKYVATLNVLALINHLHHDSLLARGTAEAALSENMQNVWTVIQKLHSYLSHH